jgi:alkylation response protein AidB-like acyl-CoA dehydrogenase
MSAKGEAFLSRLRVFLSERVDPLQIERDARIEDDVVQGLKELGALGIKVPEEYGGLGLSQVYYNKALALAGTWHAAIATLLSAHQSIGLRSRCACSAPKSRSASGFRRWRARTSPPSC